MHIIQRTRSSFILRFQRGEEVISQFTLFCKQENIQAGWIQGLGAADKVEISYYDLGAKSYSKKLFEEDLEVLNITGNVAMLDGKQIVHVHGSFSCKDFSCIGGHIHFLQVSGTLELFLQSFEKSLERALDKETGLNLLKT